MTESDHTDDTGIASELKSTTDGFTVHHIDEQAAERAVDEFRRKADRIENGDANDITASGTVYLQDSIHDIVSNGPAACLVDGQPLDEWLDGRLDRTAVEADE